jgi:nucleotide-binding universal stress UspA family protein
MTTKKILLAVDRSSRASAMAGLVADTARGAHAAVRLLHVAPSRRPSRTPTAGSWSTPTRSRPAG